jgi:hypothetical protein
MRTKIQWPDGWNPSEGWPMSIPGVNDSTVAKAVEKLGGPKATSKGSRGAGAEGELAERRSRVAPLAEHQEVVERFRFFTHPRVEELIALSGVAGLRAEFDDENEEVRLSTDGKNWSEFMLVMDAEIAIMNWPGSRIEDLDEENSPILRSATRFERNVLEESHVENECW